MDDNNLSDLDWQNNDNSTIQKNEVNERCEKIKKLEQSWFIVFPEKFDKTNDIIDLLKEEWKYSVCNFSDVIEDNKRDVFSIAWRIMSFRSHGKISFASIKDYTWDIQLAFVKWSLKINDWKKINEIIKFWEEEIDAYKFIQKFIDIWDIVWVYWNLFITNKWELTLFVKEFQLLTKAINPLPEKFHWLKDSETRFRKRYLDMLLNKDTKDTIKRRSLFFKAIRDFLNSIWFMEVDTPILENTTWWADARPFSTKYNAYDIDVYLRISVWELWQKRLLVGWFEKIFELWRLFRNEWVSPEHAQDYNQVEIYWAYSDYKQMMKLVKDLYLYIIDNVYWKRKFNIRWYEIDFDNDWYEIEYTNIIKEKTWIDIFNSTDEEIENKLKELNIEIEDKNRTRMVDYLWKYIRKQIPWPAFLINEPKFTSPLAKSDINNPDITHRFHVIIAWSEVGNWYSELNNPIDQKERFELQQTLRDSWDEEAQMADLDFVEALMHWMPPAAWFWVSERLLAFLENKPIKECQTFPFIKPIN